MSKQVPALCDGKPVTVTRTDTPEDGPEFSGLPTLPPTRYWSRGMRRDGREIFTSRERVGFMAQ